MSILIRVLLPAFVCPMKDTSCGFLVPSWFGHCAINELYILPSVRNGCPSLSLPIPMVEERISCQISDFLDEAEIPNHVVSTSASCSRSNSSSDTGGFKI